MTVARSMSADEERRAGASKGAADFVSSARNQHKDHIKYTWPENMRAGFGRELYLANHNGGSSPYFTDDALARLLDQYPRERLGVYRFPDHAEGRVKALHGCAPDMSGREILEAVKAGQIWLNLRAVNQHLDEYAALADSLFDQLEVASGQKTMKRDMGVLISSPNIHVHYHLDIPLVCLVQVRGIKTLYLYPVGAPYAEPAQLEDIVLRTQDEELTYRHAFDEAARVIELKPGMAMTWPQTAPHRVQNSDMLNVSLSCEYMTLPALMKANALYMNGKLRRTFGYDQPFPQSAGPLTLVKAASAQALKKIQPVPGKSPTPLTFELKAGGVIEDLPIAADVADREGYACTVKRFDELGEDERKNWARLCLADERFKSPLLAPDFTGLISSVRDDVRIVLVSRGDRLVAVMPVHERRGGLVRPVGAPFCDISGPIISSECDLGIADILELAGYSVFRSSTAIVPAGDGGATNSEEESFAIRLGDLSPEAYLETRRAQHAKRFKNFRRLISKLNREKGELEFVWGAPSQTDLDDLYRWKSQQFQDEGLLDLTRADNSRLVLDAAASNPWSADNRFGGFITALKIDGKLIAAHFGVRKYGCFHPWVSAFDPELGDYSPGVLLLYRAIEMMEDMGLSIYELATGHDFYKKYFADPVRTVFDVEVYRPTASGRRQKMAFDSWKIAGKHADGLSARIRRRLDHAVICHSSRRGAMGDLMMAVQKRGGAQARGHQPPAAGE
ncbi:MAG: hypothetical protein CMK07_05030 [Ponticaulis sp.]|nr:hypothetical protein [Ponticaulis sp.]